MTRPLPLWLITALYYAAWIATVQLAALGAPAWGALIHVAYGVALIYLSPRALRGPLWRRGLSGALLGYGFDSALCQAGLISFPPLAQLGLGPSPLWMVSLWFTFAVLLSRELSWLLTRPALGLGLGLIGGPSSYLGGAQTGAMIIHGSSGRAALLIGLAWACVMWLASRAWAPLLELSEGAATPEAEDEQATPERSEATQEPKEL